MDHRFALLKVSGIDAGLLEGKGGGDAGMSGPRGSAIHRRPLHDPGAVPRQRLRPASCARRLWTVGSSKPQGPQPTRESSSIRLVGDEKFWRHENPPVPAALQGAQRFFRPTAAIFTVAGVANEIVPMPAPVAAPNGVDAITLLEKISQWKSRVFAEGIVSGPHSSGGQSPGPAGRAPGAPASLEPCGLRRKLTSRPGHHMVPVPVRGGRHAAPMGSRPPA